jgi:hypothetical protein
MGGAMTAKPPKMTTDAGISVASHGYSLTVGPAGPHLLTALGTSSFPIRFPSGCSLRSRPHRKLGAHSRGEAVQRARAIGLLSGPSAGSSTPTGRTAAHT